MDTKSNAELRQYLGVIAKWWWLILIVTAMAGASAYLVSSASPKTYQSKTTVLVGNEFSSVVYNPQAGQASESLAQTYAEIAKREPVLQGTLDAMKLDWTLDAFRPMVTARVVAGQPLIELSVIDDDPIRAKYLAENLTNQLLLQAPGANDPEMEARKTRMKVEIKDIESNIDNARVEVKRLDEDIAKATSQRQAQEAQGKQRTLQEKISNWQATLASMNQSLGTSSPNVLTVIEKPVVPTTPVGPRVPESTLLAAAIGLMLAVVAAFVIESLDDTVKTAEDVRGLLNLAPMGIITKIETGTDYPDKLVVSKFPLSSAAESYRILRTNLQFKMVERSIRSIMVTSTQPMEGKSVTAANLAAVLAQSGKKVVLVDADLRRPTQHRVFELSNSNGLTGALLEEKASLKDFMREDVIDNLSVMASGPLPPNPSELLGSKRMADVIAQFQDICDIVIFDTAPVMAVADATALASQVDGVLLVVDSGHTRRKMARLTVEALQAVGANVMGVVLNRVSKRGKEAGYTYYYPQRKDNEQPTNKNKKKPPQLKSPTKPQALPAPAAPAKLQSPSNANANTPINGVATTTIIERQTG